MDLFVSYARDDVQSVERIVRLLRIGGHLPWFDDHLVAGQAWIAAIQQAISACERFVYMVSPGSVVSPWCQWEFAQAVRQGKPVVPVLVVSSAEIHPALQRLQYADFSNGITPEAVADLTNGLWVAAPHSIPPAEVEDLPFDPPEGVPPRADSAASRRADRLQPDSTSLDCNRSVRSIAFSPDGTQLAAATELGNIIIWSLQPPVSHYVLQGHREHVRAIAFAPDGTRLVSAANDHNVCLWDLTGETDQVVLEGHSGRVRDVAYAPDGRWITSVSRDNTLRVWSTEPPYLCKFCRQTPDSLHSVAYSPDGSLLATGSAEALITLWYMPDATEAAVLEGHDYLVRTLAFSPDGLVLASGSWDRTVRLWSVPEQRLLFTLTSPHRSQIESVAFSPDGLLLASGANDGTIRLWEVSSGRLLRVIDAHPYTVFSVAFAPDGSRMASGSFDGTVQFWAFGD